MFSFFRINDPYRILIIFLWIATIHSPIFFDRALLTVPELKWMLIGEKLADGGIVYRDLWTELAPLSTLVYQLLDYLFGRSRFVYEFLGLILISYQAFVLNQTFIRIKAYMTYSYVPALFYGLLSQIFFDVSVLSPTMMGLTFILHALKFTFINIDSNNRKDNSFLLSGIHIGIACLFESSFILFLFAILLNYAALTIVILRRYILLHYGLSMVLFLCYAYLYLFNADKDFLISQIYPIFYFEHEWLLSIKELGMLLALPSIFVLLGAFGLISITNFNVLQGKFQRGMGIFLLLSIFVFIISPNKSSHLLVLFIPSFSFFISHYFLSFKRKDRRELLFILFIGVMVFGNYSLSKGWFKVEQIFNKTNLLINMNTDLPLTHGKKLWVTGGDVFYYKNHKLATRYFNAKLSGLHLDKLNYYDNLTMIYETLMSDPPDLILDTRNIITDLFNRLPQVASKYEKVKGEEGLYQLKDN